MTTATPNAFQEINDCLAIYQEDSRMKEQVRKEIYDIWMRQYTDNGLQADYYAELVNALSDFHMAAVDAKIAPYNKQRLSEDVIFNVFTRTVIHGTTERLFLDLQKALVRTMSEHNPATKLELSALRELMDSYSIAKENQSVLIGGMFMMIIVMGIKS